MDAELHGIICSGPRRGNQFTYALIEERAAPAPPLHARGGAGGAGAALLHQPRPASVRDFVWWSGLTTADARAGIAMLGGDASDELIDDVRCWSLPAQQASAARALPPAAHLLPNYDEYLIAYKDRGFSVTAGGQTFDDFYAHFLTIDGLSGRHMAADRHERHGDNHGPDHEAAVTIGQGPRGCVCRAACAVHGAQGGAPLLD